MFFTAKASLPALKRVGFEEDQRLELGKSRTLGGIMQVQGWHILVLIALVIMAVVIVAVVLIVKAVSKRSHTPAATTTRQPSGKEQRLAELDDLRARGQITGVEYEAARADILRS